MQHKMNAQLCRAEEDARSMLRRAFNIERWRDYVIKQRNARKDEQGKAVVEFAIRFKPRSCGNIPQKYVDRFTLRIDVVCNMLEYCPNTYNDEKEWYTRHLRIALLGEEVLFILNQIGAITAIHMGDQYLFLGDESENADDGGEKGKCEIALAEVRKIFGTNSI